MNDTTDHQDLEITFLAYSTSFVTYLDNVRFQATVIARSVLCDEAISFLRHGDCFAPLAMTNVTLSSYFAIAIACFAVATAYSAIAIAYPAIAIAYSTIATACSAISIAYSAIATAYSAIATAYSAIATAYSAIAIAYLAIATANFIIATASFAILFSHKIREAMKGSKIRTTQPVIASGAKQSQRCKKEIASSQRTLLAMTEAAE